MRRISPYFEEDGFSAGARKDPEKTLANLSMRETGEIATRQHMALHASYLLEYGADRTLNAAWALALSACMLDDEQSLPFLDRAVQMGLPEEEVLRMGVVLDSRIAGQFLARRVDWANFHVLPLEEDNRLAFSSYPMDALIEGALDRGGRQHYKYRKRVSAVDILFGAAGSLSHKKLVAALIEEGVDPHARLPTRALGLSDGKASILSLALVSMNLDAADMLLDQKPPTQDVLDEALLALGMGMGFNRIPEDDRSGNRKLAAMAKKLVALGANIDRKHAFGFPAASALMGLFRAHRAQGEEISTRQWVLRSLISNEYPGTVVKAFLSTKWPAPKASQEEGWLGDVALHCEDTGNAPGKELVFLAMKASRKVPLARQLRGVMPVFSGAWHSHTVLEAVDGFLGACKRLDLSFSAGDADAVFNAVAMMGSLDNVQALYAGKSEWWGTDRPERFAALLPQEGRDMVMDKIAIVRKTINKFDTGKMTQEEEEALLMTLSSLMQEGTLPGAPKPRRRL